MRDPQSKTIGDITFEVTPLGFKQGRKAFVRLSKVVGPALASTPSVEAAKRGENVTQILESLVTNISDGELEWFSEALGKTTRFSRDGTKWPFLNGANREMLFSGEIVLFFKWLLFALEVNFSDFLELLRSGAGEAALSESGITSPKAT